MIVIVLALLLQPPQRPEAGAEVAAALRPRTDCRDAGDKFWQREGFAAVSDPRLDYFTHYNREESKCFIRVSGMAKAEPGEAKAAMFMQVFDAVAGGLVSSKILRWNGNDYVTTRVRDTRGVHEHNPPTPADEAWFDSLMIR